MLLSSLPEPAVLAAFIPVNVSMQRWADLCHRWICMFLICLGILSLLQTCNVVNIETSLLLWTSHDTTSKIIATDVDRSYFPKWMSWTGTLPSIIWPLSLVSLTNEISFILLAKKANRAGVLTWKSFWLSAKSVKYTGDSPAPKLVKGLFNVSQQHGVVKPLDCQKIGS